MPVHLIDQTLATPEANLALDEALLRLSDANRGVETGFLRFWESPVHFVVLGVSGRIREEVEVERCAADAIPVLRRASGGGTVLQGPGCFNVALVLPLGAFRGLEDVNESHRSIIEKTVSALGLAEGTMRGTSDLALGEFKFGGSAQKRTPRALLHHATVLYDFDLDVVGRYLKEPVKQPKYRHGRRHRDFVTNVELSGAEIRARLTEAWGGEPVDSSWTAPDLTALIAEKYGRREWTERF